MSGRMGIIACLWLAALPVGAQESAFAPSLQNPSFETPASLEDTNAAPPEIWHYFSSKPGARVGVTASAKRSGGQSLTLKAPPRDNEFVGVAQSFPVSPGYHYVFAAHVIGDAPDRLVGEAFGQMHFEWRDAQGKEITRTWGPTWNAQLPTRRWERFMVEGDAPDGAVSGIVVMTLHSKNSGGRGTVYIDDCEFGGGLRVSGSPRRGPTNSADRIRRPPSPLRQKTPPGP